MNLNRKFFVLIAHTLVALGITLTGIQTTSAAAADQSTTKSEAPTSQDGAVKAYQELIEASQQIEKFIQQSSYKMKNPGHKPFKLPLNGEIVTTFGWSTHPIFGTQKFHSGLDIYGDYGIPILSAGDGVIIYAGWISGYGNTVIIDHGDKVTTLYAHNDSILVDEGQTVIQGQKIAFCGSTGYATGPYCHFEVRENGAVVDPLGYLKKLKPDVSSK